MKLTITSSKIVTWTLRLLVGKRGSGTASCQTSFVTGWPIMSNAAGLNTHEINKIKLLTISREIIAAEKSRLSWLVVQRLFFLQGKKHFLELNGDYDEQMANIMGLMAAYRAGKKFKKGRISYWHKGAQIYPQKDGDELDYWQATHLQSRFTGAKGFWVEGVRII